MRSGANIIIEQTECLTAIDVNSSKNIKGKLSEDVIFQINKEAAAEAAVQIRLRNLSGIIIIDFINMKDKEREGELLAYLKSLTAKDPVTTRVVDMTPLGLVEITRKKIYPSLKEQLYHEIR
jgi:ribonuclease G